MTLAADHPAITKLLDAGVTTDQHQVTASVVHHEPQRPAKVAEVAEGAEGGAL